MVTEVYTLFLVSMLGLAMGSFVNALAWRLPRGSNWVGERSKCINCEHTLAWYDLVPVFSWLYLRGRCRYCHKAISIQYILVELLCGFLFALSYVYLFDFGIIYMVFAMFLVCMFILLALIDFRHYILPDTILIFSAGVSIIYLLWHNSRYGETDLFQIIHINEVGVFTRLDLGNILAIFFIYAILFLLWQTSGGRWFGLGDVKYLALLILLFGLRGGIMVLYLAIVIGAVASILLMVTKKAGLKTKLPFGVFLSVSAIAFLFIGTHLIENYFQYFFFLNG